MTGTVLCKKNKYFAMTKLHKQVRYDQVFISRETFTSFPSPLGRNTIIKERGKHPGKEVKVKRGFAVARDFVANEV
ncbi:hypothetical protein CEXT_112141 [Caerostris extrusa]|uniref:Uncharacterized protein n=1 Tax=Caerostris extrusa TaxID=172846 RepID=A0AAV4SZ95_CAEEX|nr:hypothetical protein CEXT_112141 [Caerostris extrusa]